MSALIPRETLTEEPRPVRLPVLIPVGFVEGMSEIPIVLSAKQLASLIECGLANLDKFGVGEEPGSVMMLEQIVAARTV